MSTHTKVVINDQMELDTATMTEASMKLLFPTTADVLEDKDQLWRVVHTCVLLIHIKTAKSNPPVVLPADCGIRTDVEGSLGVEFISVNLLRELFLNNVPLYESFMASIAKKGLRKELKDQIGMHVNNAQRHNKKVLLRRRSLVVDQFDDGTMIPASLMNLTGPRKQRASPVDKVCKAALRAFFIANKAEEWTKAVKKGKLKDLLSCAAFSHLNKTQLNRLFKMFVSEKTTRLQFGKKLLDATREMRSENSDFAKTIIFDILADWEYQYRNLHSGMHLMPSELRTFCLRCNIAHFKHLDGVADSLSATDKLRVESFRKLIVYCYIPMFEQLWGKFQTMEETTTNFMSGDATEIIANMTLDLEHQLRLAVSNPNSHLRKMFVGNTFVLDAVVNIDPALLYPEVKEYYPRDVHVEVFHYPPDWMYDAVHERKLDPLISMLLMSFSLLFYTYYKKNLVINDVRVLSKGGRPRNADSDSGVSAYISDPDESDSGEEDDDDVDDGDDGPAGKNNPNELQETLQGMMSARAGEGETTSSSKSASAVTTTAAAEGGGGGGGRKPSDMSSMTLDSGCFSSGMQEVLYRIAGASVYAAIGLLGGSTGQTDVHSIIIVELFALLTVSETEAKAQRLPDRRVSRIEYAPGVCTRPSEEVWQIVLNMEMDVIQPILDNKRLIALLNKELLRFLWDKIRLHPGAKTMRRLISEAVHNAREKQTALFVQVDDETLISNVNKKFFDFYCGASAVDCFKKILEHSQYDRLMDKIGFRMKVLIGLDASEKTSSSSK
jgi:hypothetical protein